MAKSGVEIVVDNTDAVMRAIRAVTTTDVLVGVPRETAQTGGQNNALIAYVAEYGSPLHNVPARPILRPAIAGMKGTIISAMRQAGKQALAGQPDRMRSTLESLGLACARAAQRRIQDNLSPPLAPSTVEGRLRRTQGGRATLARFRRQLRAKGAIQAGKKRFGSIAAWGAVNLTPYYDTGAFLRSISYVLRRRGR